MFKNSDIPGWFQPQEIRCVCEPLYQLPAREPGGRLNLERDWIKLPNATWHATYNDKRVLDWMEGYGKTRKQAIDNLLRVVCDPLYALRFRQYLKSFVPWRED